jgi:transposase
MCQPGEILHTWSNGRRIYLESHRRRWECCDCKRTFAEGRELVRPAPDLPGRLKPRPCGSSRIETSAR